MREVTLVNEQIRTLASVLNSPSLPKRVTVEAPGEIATMVKRLGDATYVFAANMQKKTITARLQLAGISGPRALVLGEDRLVTVEGGAIRDMFADYGVHLYKIPDKD